MNIPQLAGTIAGKAGNAAEAIGKGFNHVVLDTDVQVTKALHGKVSTNMANRIGAAVGGDVGGTVLGAAGGLAVGGVVGGIDEDETVLGGALKGATLGSVIGGFGGAVQGFARNDSDLIATAAKDLKYAKAAASRGLGKDGGVLK